MTGRRFSGYQETCDPVPLAGSLGLSFGERPKLRAWPSLRDRLSGTEVRRLFSAEGGRIIQRGECVKCALNIWLVLICAKCRCAGRFAHAREFKRKDREDRKEEAGSKSAARVDAEWGRDVGYQAEGEIDCVNITVLCIGRLLCFWHARGLNSIRFLFVGFGRLY